MLQEPGVFQTAKCFVGWYERAEILLGTNELPSTIGWSGALKCTRSRHITGGSLAVTARSHCRSYCLCPGGASVGVNWTWVNNVQSHNPSKSIEATSLANECDKTALVVDLPVKRAYLVPKLSLLLHLCRVESHEQAGRDANNRLDDSHSSGQAID